MRKLVMLVRNATAPRFNHDGTEFVGLAAPSRGSKEIAAWRCRLAPGTVGATHRLTREEVFVALCGSARATIDEVEHRLDGGDALIVPAGSAFRLANPGPEPFVAIAVLPVGGEAVLPGKAPFTPPWAA